MSARPGDSAEMEHRVRAVESIEDPAASAISTWRSGKWLARADAVHSQHFVAVAQHLRIARRPSRPAPPVTTILFMRRVSACGWRRLREEDDRRIEPRSDIRIESRQPVAFLVISAWR